MSEAVSKEFLDHVVSHHGFEVSIIWMTNHSQVFASEFGCKDIFLGKR